MSKIFKQVLCLLLVLTLVGCGKKKKDPEDFYVLTGMTTKADTNLSVSYSQTYDYDKDEETITLASDGVLTYSDLIVSPTKTMFLHMYDVNLQKAIIPYFKNFIMTYYERINEGDKGKLLTNKESITVENDLIKKYTTKDNIYTFTYDKGLVTEIKGEEITYTFTYDDNKLTSIDEKGNTYEELTTYTYDKKGNLIKIEKKDMYEGDTTTEVKEYTYKGNILQSSTTTSPGGTSETTYTVDDNGCIVKAVEKSQFTEDFSYTTTYTYTWDTLTNLLD